MTLIESIARDKHARIAPKLASRASTYYAEMQIEGPTGVVEVDARPSDSIAIALRLDAPIFAPSSLLTTLDDTAEAEGEELSVDPPDSELTAEQLKAYLENLRPEDFGKFSP